MLPAAAAAAADVVVHCLVVTGPCRSLHFLSFFREGVTMYCTHCTPEGGDAI